jgi:lysophospholipase L1-like esterase
MRRFPRRLAGRAALLALLLAGCSTAQTPVASGPVPPPLAAAPRPAASPPNGEKAQLVSHHAGASRQRQGLAGFYEDLHQLEQGGIRQLHIVQIGDSHTAGDFFSGRLRELFQQRFGNGGRGMMPPGHPYNGLRQHELLVSQKGQWTVSNSLTSAVPQPFGISGFLITSGGPGASIALSPTEGTQVDRIEIGYLLRPQGGSFQILVDGQIAQIVSVDGPAGQRGRVSLGVARGARSFEVVPQSAGISFTDWSADRADSGVLLDSFGVVSATASLPSKWSDAVLADDLNDLDPSLIIVAYGTNEGVQANLDIAAYEAGYAALLARLRQMAPQASLLVVAPPDVQRARPNCKGKACRWTTPVTVAQVRAAQKRAADKAGAAYWDWSSVMPEGIGRWADAEPPLARGDHVHFTPKGYEIAGDALFSFLMKAYQK